MFHDSAGSEVGIFACYFIRILRIHTAHLMQLHFLPDVEIGTRQVSAGTICKGGQRTPYAALIQRVIHLCKVFNGTEQRGGQPFQVVGR